MWNPFKPKIENSDPGQRSLQLISQKGMPFAYVEAYKSLRTNLNFLTSSTGARAIVVTSTMPEEAKSNVSVNLALTLAEDGKNVALVDCDLRKPVLHKYLKAGHNVKGVSNIVSNQCKLEEALLRLEQLKITFLPAGTPPPNPSELLGSARMQQMIATDPHSPPQFRVIGPLRNIDAWYTAFQVKDGQGLYLKPENRVKLW